MTAYIVSKLEAEKEKRIRVVAVMAGIVILLLASCIVFFQLLLKNERLEIESHIKEVAKQSAVAANLLIRGDFQTLTLYSHVLENEPSDLEKSQIIRNLQNAIKNTQFLSMGVIYPSGEARIYDIKDGIPPVIDVNNYAYFKEAMKGHNSIDFTQCFYDNDNSRVISAVPIMGKNKPIAILTGSHDASDYKNAIDITAFNGEAVVYIIDERGNLLLRDSNSKALIKKSVFESGVVPDKVRNEALMSREPVSYWFKDSDGVKKVAAYVPLGYSNWKVLAVLPFSAINHNSKMILQYSVFFFILINAVVILAVRYSLKIKQHANNIIMDMALKDDVTGLMNKTSFYIETEKILLKYKYEIGDKVAIILMDINNFKVVNEAYSMKKGDKVLKDIARFISKAIEEKGICARLNDDVFAITYKYKTEDEIIAMISAITVEFVKYKLNIRLIPSFGIFRVIDTTMPINTMCDRANIAKREVKGLVSGDRYAFFDEKLNEAMIADNEIESEMHNALKEHQFVMYLQPKINMKSLKICGSEALIRWVHPQKGLIPPNKFIPLFEKNGFVLDVDKYIWEEACKTIRKWLDEGKEPLPISVNLSRIHFKYEDLVEIIQNLVQKYNVPHKYLELELTESAFLDNEGTVNSTLIRLQQLGFNIAMDDFGVGYSSLNMLRELPVNVLKLDKGFINEATCTERGFIVLTHVIKMAKDLNATVVCEGIETDEQAEALRKSGCDIAQGYLYSKPMPLDEYENFVEQNNNANSNVV